MELFRNTGHVMVQDTMNYQQAYLEYNLHRADFIAQRRAKLEDEGARVTEVLLSSEAIQQPFLIEKLKESLRLKAVAERARVDYLVTGYQLSGHWPPLPDVKDGGRLWN